MARARNIKPGFFTNEDLAECSFAARLCFAGLWMICDREGRLEDRPKRIKGELFRFDAIEVSPLLDELAEHGFLLRYANAAGRFIQIHTFVDHQRPHYSEKPSVIEPPEFEEQNAKPLGSGAHDDPSIPEPDHETPPHDAPEFPEFSGDVPNQVAMKGGSNCPELLNPELLNAESLNAEARDSAALLRIVPPTPPPAFDGSNFDALNGKAVVTISTAWELPEAWGIDAEALGWKPAEVLREAEKFRQFWTAGNGKGKRRSVKGWRQSWSNWLGKAAERMQR